VISQSVRKVASILGLVFDYFAARFLEVEEDLGESFQLLNAVRDESLSDGLNAFVDLLEDWITDISLFLNLLENSLVLDSTLTLNHALALTKHGLS